MLSMRCMNDRCHFVRSPVWKNGWVLKSGGFATLCYSCGFAYERFMYCEKFHKEEDGWRECRICKKPVHCGCVASKMLIEHLDTGGVACVSCVKSRDAAPLQPVQIVGDEIIANRTLSTDVVPTVGNHRNFGDLLQIGSSFDVNGSRKVLKTQIYGNASSYLGQSRSEGTMLPFGEVNIGSPHFTQQPVGSSVYLTPGNHAPEQGVKDSLVQSPLDTPLSNAFSASSSGIPFSDVHVEGSDQNKGSPTQKSGSVLPQPPKPVSSAGADATRSSSQPRIARPPADGRGRSQLLPRYWPRITEQELQQISGDLKSTIVPLFEKVLSASDAGRIGRLVLPKACAEAYFPPINQSEGLPIRIQDVKGKEWTFQFRFWPNNNSRMYVLEGVTPCIQNMKLQAGDTVTFSRIDPGGQLVMGFRKSTSNVDVQDPQSSVIPNGGSSGENSHSGASDNVINGSHTAEDSLRQPLISEKKKARNVGKNKRLLMRSDDALELKVTWEEVQELLRPHPTSNPTVTKIDDYEFEEYVEPPVFGKKTVFTAGSSGQQEQLVQCDNCSKWRKLPVDFLAPASWTCSENIYDPNSSCSAPDEINLKEEDALNKASKDYKRKMIGSSVESLPSGLDTLAATAAVLGANRGDLVENTVEATTTRHPRHRPGCSCIVCIQPPSGKGKHPQQCKCNVCATVKRRFKTLMQRRKKRQSEREVEVSPGLIQVNSRDASALGGATEVAVVEVNALGTVVNQAGNQVDVEENGKGHLDLNSHPGREEDMLAEESSANGTPDRKDDEKQ